MSTEEYRGTAVVRTETWTRSRRGDGSLRRGGVRRGTIDTPGMEVPKKNYRNNSILSVQYANWVNLLC